MTSRTIAAMIVPASDEYKVPGADDPAIQADILTTLGRDTNLVAGAGPSGAPRGASRSPSSMPPGAMRWRRSSAAPAAAPPRPSSASSCNAITATTSVLRSLGLELRAPFPKGYVLPDGDWSLLDPVKARAGTLRRAP